MLTRSLLALALLATPVYAAPFDGSETAGQICAATVQEQADGKTFVGYMTGGPFAAADVVANNSGVVGVDSQPGPATELTMRCTIYGNWGTTVFASAQTGPSTGAVVLTPSALAWETWSYDSYRICTVVTWKDTHGNTQSYAPDCPNVTIQ